VPGQAGRPQDGRREFPPCAFCAHLTLTDWRRFRDGRDLDRFLDAHRNLVRGVAWRYTHGARVRLQDNEADRWRLRVDDDFVQVGSQALLYALGKYDPLRGVPFDAFVRPLIEKRVLSERRRMKRITSHEVAATEFEAAHECDDCEDDRDWTELAGAAHEDHAASVFDRVTVEVALRRLPEQQRRVVFLREVEDLTQSTVADVLGLCERWVRELETAAWRRLAPLLAEAA
jgi:RNA polymerase sigma factor (sigma-70 family)